MTVTEIAEMRERIQHHRDMLIYLLECASRAEEVGSLASAARSITEAAEHASIASELRAMLEGK